MALVGKDLERLREDVVAVLKLGTPYSDPAVARFGLSNLVWPIGDTFLEIVSPAAEGTTAERLLEKRGGDGGYMTIFQTGDQRAARARAMDNGVRIVDTFDQEGASYAHFHPKDLPGAIVSVDTMIPPDRWEWGGPGWQGQVRTEVATRICGGSIEISGAAMVAERWSAALGLPLRSGENQLSLIFEGGELRFVEPLEGPGAGLDTIDLEVRSAAVVMDAARRRNCLSERNEVLLCGTKVRLLEA
jgi:hypothetical protein